MRLMKQRCKIQINKAVDKAIEPKSVFSVIILLSKNSELNLKLNSW